MRKLRAAATPAAAVAPWRTPDVLPFVAVERTLANGLRIIAVPTGFPDLVSVHVAVRAGSRNEVEPGKSGFAHFFEHMMFRGTRAYPPEKYQAVVARLGARQNAYTSDDVTSYHVTFAKEDLEKVLEIEADRFTNLEYSTEAFKTESRAVLGEYDKNASNPRRKLDEVQRDAAYRIHTYKHTTMGLLADIEDMPNQFEYSKVFYARWYRPEHTTVVVAGDILPEKVIPLVERHFGRWRRGISRPVEIPKEPPPAGPVYARVPWPTETLPWVAVAFHGPAFSATAKDWAAADLLLGLHFGETSELRRRLVVEEQVVDALFTANGPNVDPGLQTVYARLKRPEDAVRVRDEILKAFAGARAAPPDARRLADEVVHARNAFSRRLDSTDAIGGRIAAYAVFERSYRTLNQLHRTAAALTPADLQAAARAWFTDARLVVTTLSKEPLPAGIEKPPALDALARLAAEADVPIVPVASRLPVVTREYLAKNVAVMTARQEEQVGYALDSRWYGIPDFTTYVREGLARLTRDGVNAAVKRHLSVRDLSFVFVTRDAKALAGALLADAPTTMTYEAEKPAALLEEDRRIGATKLGLRPEAVRITKVAEVFAR